MSEATPGSWATQGSTLPARWRIVGWLMLTTILGLTALVTTVHSTLRAEVDRAANEDVIQEISEFREFAQTGRDPATTAPFDSTERILEVFLDRQNPGAGEHLVGELDGSGVVHERHGPRMDDTAAREVLAEEEAREAFASSDSGVLQTRAGEVRWGKADLRDGPGGDDGRFVVAVFVEPAHERVDHTLQLMVTVSVGVLIFIAVIAHVVAGRILAPVRAVRETAESISRHDLAARIPVHTGDELGELSATINEMLERIERAFATEQRFVEDAARELRQPIDDARLRLADLPTDPGERERAISRVAAELTETGRTVDDLRALSAAERPDFVRPRPVSATHLMLDLREAAEKVADRRWHLGAVAAVTVTLDPDRMRQAVTELARNAAAHTSFGSTVQLESRVVADDMGTWWQVSVTDDGPGVGAEDAERIFERFVHGPPPAGRREGRRGAGLGLALVRAVAEAHGGSAFVESRPGSGATFGLLVPISFSEVPGQSALHPADPADRPRQEA